MLCPYCRTENRPGAVRCAACTSWITERPPVREWNRAREGKILGGVSRGLANHFAVPVAIVRLMFALSIVLGGWGVLVYAILWVAMPLEPWPTSRLPPPMDPPRPAEAITAPPA
jgi:phage shock protein C